MTLCEVTPVSQQGWVALEVLRAALVRTAMWQSLGQVVGRFKMPTTLPSLLGKDTQLIFCLLVPEVHSDLYIVQ